MRHALALGLLVGLCVRGDGGAQPPTAPVVGFYHWGGAAATSVSQGVVRIAELGGRAARLTLSPRYYTDYNRGPGCYPGFSLTTLAQEADVRQALGNARIAFVMLTAYDGTSFSDCATHRYLQPAFYTAHNRAALVQEYSEFTLHLHREYTNTGKQFVISNWEADNAVYCGAAYAYATSHAFRDACNTGYSQVYGNRQPAESLEGLRLWFQARELGIAEGNRRAEALGLGGVEVYQAPEISIVRALREAGLQSVLYDVLPTLGCSRVSYSAYESINQTDPVLALQMDLEQIRAITGANQVILGELGFARSVWGTQAESRTSSVLAAAAASGIQLLFYWQLFDQDAQNDFGLYDLGDQLTEVGRYFLRLLSPSGARSSGGQRRPAPGSPTGRGR